MSESYVIGIDIGTGSTKAVVVTAAGTISYGTQVHYPSDTSLQERSATIFFEAFSECLKVLVSKAGSPPAAISLSCNMHSVLAMDRNGQPLTNAILWSDSRSSAIAESLRNSETGKEIYLATGTPLHAMTPLCKIRWIKEHQPEIFDATWKFISIKEYIWQRLFGVYEVDHSIASATGLFDIHSLQWYPPALEFAGISAEKLSQPVPTTYIRQGVSDPASEALSIPHDTKICVGASDGCLASLGSLCLQPDVAAVTVGTSGAVRVTRKTPLHQTEQMPFSYILEAGSFVCGGAINNGGNVVQWLIKNFLFVDSGEDPYQRLFTQIESVSPGSNGLLFLPYLHGERAPIWEEKSCGVFFGIRPSHTKAHFVRAGLEGICFALNHILSILETEEKIREIRFSGGLSRSKVMLQLLADITGKKVIRQQEEDASSIGAAYLGLRSTGLMKNYSLLSPIDISVTHPRKENRGNYGRLFSLYTELYDSIKGHMHRLSLFNTGDR